MKLLRVLAVFSFVAGLGLLVLGFVRSGGGDDTAAAPESFGFDATATATPPIEEATEPPTIAPTSTPLPFDGKVARLKLPRFEVDSKVEAIGLLPGNQLDTPHNPLDSGWYEIYDKPGFRGNSVFSAHVDYFPNIRGPFYNLFKAEPNDDVVVIMEDGTEYRYRVIRKKRYDVNTIPMGELIWPPDKPVTAEWITLITCGGRFQSAGPNQPGEYLDRDVVVAERYQ